MSVEESEDGIWHCSAVLPYKLLQKSPQKIRKTIMRTKRRKEVYKIIPSAGWHFTYLGGVDKIVQKLEAFSHTEFNNSEFKNIDKINQQLKDGVDVLGRDLKFKILDNFDELPEYLQKNYLNENYKENFIQKN